MIGLREFKVLDPTRHNPAIGIGYGTEPSIGRLLIVGMSHYGGEYVRWARFTHDIVTEVIRGERRIPYFTKVAGLFCDAKGRSYSPGDFYPLVAFYNFLPDEFTVRQRVEQEQWLNPDAQRFFFRVVDYVKPQRVLITGEQLWRALPSRIPEPQGTRRVCEDGTDLYVPFGGDDRECCWYSVEGAEDCLIGAISHPSTRKFNQNRTEIGDWIRQFMTWSKRIPANG
jgi:hypothetical protein